MDEAALAGVLGQHAVRHSVPGASVGILRDGAVTVAHHGVADVRTGEPVTGETRFSVGSLTKSMVATVIARLVKRGGLSLEDPVGAHVPELHGRAWARRATVRDLLANRSGLPLQAGLEFGFGDRSETDDGALSRFATEIALGVPVDGLWSYSNAGWCLLGRVIETVTGIVWEEATRRHLLEPAGMRGTTFVTSTDGTPRASGHEITSDGPVPVEPLITRAYGPAGTSAICGIRDLLAFARMHLQEPSLAHLRNVHAQIRIPGWLDSWCLGWACFDWAGGPVYGWDSVVPGERSVLRILPEQHAAMALMTNTTTGRAMYRSLFTELMGSLFGVTVSSAKLTASPGAAGDLTRFTGVYAWPDRSAEVTATDSALLINTEDDVLEALPIDERTFLVDRTDPDNPTVTFAAFDATGRPDALYLMLWGLPRLHT